MHTWAIPAFTAQSQSITALWPVFISRATKVKRLSWPVWSLKHLLQVKCKCKVCSFNSCLFDWMYQLAAKTGYGVTEPLIQDTAAFASYQSVGFSHSKSFARLSLLRKMKLGVKSPIYFLILHSCNTVCAVSLQCRGNSKSRPSVLISDDVSSPNLVMSRAGLAPCSVGTLNNSWLCSPAQCCRHFIWVVENFCFCHFGSVGSCCYLGNRATLFLGGNVLVLCGDVWRLAVILNRHMDVTFFVPKMFGSHSGCEEWC